MNGIKVDFAHHSAVVGKSDDSISTFVVPDVLGFCLRKSEGKLGINVLKQ